MDDPSTPRVRTSRPLPSIEDWQRARARSDAYDIQPGPHRVVHDSSFVGTSLIESWTKMAANAPDRPCIADNGLPLTRRQFVDLTRRIAWAIARAEPGAGPVALLLPDGALCGAAIFAGLIAGVPLLLLDDSNPAPRNAEIIRQARATLVVVRDKGDPPAEAAAGVPLLEVGDHATLPAPGAWADVTRIAPGDAAFIVTTSGSTGNPKLVVHSHQGLAYRGALYAACMALTDADRYLSCTSALCTYSGLVYLTGALCAGAYTHVAAIRKLGLRGLFDLMRDQQITAMRSAPSLLRTILPMPDSVTAFARVRSIRLTGEQGTWDDIALIRRVVGPACRITNSYGSTEAVSFNWTDTGDRTPDPVRIPAGVPFPDAEVVVVDEDGQVCAPTQTGELLTRSRFNALGEIEDGRLVQGRLIQDQDDPDTRIYATGDLARMTEDGLFVILGRKDRMLNINGLRVEPIEVEAAIRSEAGVVDVLVLPRVVQGATTLIAFVAHAADAPTDLGQVLRRHLQQQMPAYMVPSRIVVMPELPRLPGGKIDGVTLLASVN